MCSRLDRVINWNDLSHQAGYHTEALARHCGVSVRQLERYFLEVFHATPRAWLHDLRSRRACELIRDGSTIKEVVGELGYKTVAHFSRDFKKAHGLPPGRYATRVPLPQS